MRPRARPPAPEVSAAREVADLEKQLRGLDPVDAADKVAEALDDCNRRFEYVVENANEISQVYHQGLEQLRHALAEGQEQLRLTLALWHRLEAQAGGPEPLRQAYVGRYGGLPGDTGRGTQFISTPRGSLLKSSFPEVPPQYLRAQYGFIQRTQASMAESHAKTLLEVEAEHKKARRPAARKKVQDAASASATKQRAAEEAVRALPEVPRGQERLF